MVPSFSDVMLSGNRSLGWLMEMSMILLAANKATPMAQTLIAAVRLIQVGVRNFILTIIA